MIIGSTRNNDSAARIMPETRPIGARTRPSRQPPLYCIASPEEFSAAFAPCSVVSRHDFEASFVESDPRQRSQICDGVEGLRIRESRVARVHACVSGGFCVDPTRVALYEHATASGAAGYGIWMAEIRPDRRQDFVDARQVIEAANSVDLPAPVSGYISHALTSYSALVNIVETLEQAFADGVISSIRNVDVLRIRPIVDGMNATATKSDAIEHWKSILALMIDQIDEILTDGQVQGALDANPQLREDLLSLKAASQAYHGATAAVRAFYDLEADAQAVLQSMKLAAGQVAEEKLTKSFETYGDNEIKKSFWLRIASVLLVVGIAVLAWTSGAKGADSPEEWGRVGVHATVALTIGALAVYASRLAGQHRASGDWAKALEVQLRTFEAFLAPIPEEARSAIYEDFAHRVLGAPPGMAPPSLVLPADLAGRSVVRKSQDLP